MLPSLSLLLLVLVLVLVLVLLLLVCFSRRPCRRSIIAPPWSGAEQGTSSAISAPPSARLLASS